jgi:hypothetical protein
MGGGTVNVYNTTHHHNWYAMDLQTFREFAKRNKGSILEIINEDSKSYSGVMRNVVQKLR